MSNFNVRNLLLSFGLGEAKASLAIPYMFMMPRTTDPDAQAIIYIVQGLQAGLGIRQTGILDQQTVDALAQVAGPDWHSRTWVQLYGDVKHARRAIAARGSAPLSGDIMENPNASRVVYGLASAIGFAELDLQFAQKNKGKRLDGRYLATAAVGFFIGFKYRF